MPKNVEFDEPSFSMKRTSSPSQQSFLIRTVIKTGLAKTKAGAKNVLLIIALILFACAVWYYYTNNIAPTDEGTVYYEDIPADVREQIPPGKLDDIPRRN